MRRWWLVGVIVLICVLFIWWYVLSANAPREDKHVHMVDVPMQGSQLINDHVVFPERSKFSDCVAQGALPDPACTPGAVDASRSVESVCTERTQKYRKVSDSLKAEIYAEYNTPRDPKGSREHEVDHFIPLELGGSDDAANLWPEPAMPAPGFHQKDAVENYLHHQVCVAHTMTLPQAQYAIATNWLNVYQTM